MKLTPTQASHLRRSHIGLVTICALLSPLTARAQTQAAQVRPQPIAQLQVHGRITTLKFAPVGSLLACLAQLPPKGIKRGEVDTPETPRDWQLQVWDARTRQLKWSVVRPYLMSFDFSPDGTQIAFLESKQHEPDWNKWPPKEESIQVCQAQSGTLLRTIPIPGGNFMSHSWEGVQFASDNHTLFLSQIAREERHTSDKDGVRTIQLPDGWEGIWFDTRTGERLRTTHIAENYKDDATLPLVPVEYMSEASLFSHQMLLAPGGKTILVDLETTKITPPVAKVDSMGGMESFGHVTHSHHLWLCNGSGEFERQLTSTTRLTLGLSPDGSRLMCTDAPHRIQIFDVGQAKLVHTLAVPKHYSIQFIDSTSNIQASSGLISRDGRRVFATIAQDGQDEKSDSEVGEWDMASGRFLHRFGNWPSNRGSSTLALSSDDRILAHATFRSVQLEGYIQLWKVK